MINFFQSKTIAIIGASANPKKLGHHLLKNLIRAGFSGKILPINLKEKKILGLPTFSSVLDVHRKIDLAVIIVPREIVPGVLAQCVHKEIPYVLIITAGFAEKDKTGKKLQKDLLQITHHSKTKIIGPNCLGLIDSQNKINLTFAASLILKGKIGLILQSGAIGAAIFDWAKENDVGISKFISLGNKAQFGEIESLQILAADEATKIIVLYLEEISEPAKFLSTCRQITPLKPVVILKGGLTTQGAKAAATHTAALSSSSQLNETLFRQANLIVARDFEEMLNFIEIFGNKSFKVPENTLAIISNAGGPGILAADAAARNNLKLAKLSKYEQKTLKGQLSSFASLDNPFDLGGDADSQNFAKTLQIVEKSPNFSSILIILTPQTKTEIAETAQEIAKLRQSPKPIIATFLGGSQIKKGLKILAKSRIPNYDDPAEAITLLGRIYQYYKRKNTNPAPIEIKPVVNQTDLTEQEIIKTYQIPFVKTVFVNNDAELMGQMEEIGFPLVYKTAKKITHKGKTNQVGLNIGDQAALERAIRVIGFPGIIQTMVDSFFEVIVGGRRDPVFGPMVIFGQGGIFTEESEDSCLKMLPLTASDLDEMIKKTRIWQTLKTLKVENALKDLIIKVARIVLENPNISEIELNPVKVVKNQLIAVDINILKKRWINRKNC